MWFRSYLLCIFTILNYFLLNHVWKRISEPNPFNRSLYISSIHAISINIYYLYRVYLFLSQESFPPITWIHFYILSLTISYSLFDLKLYQKHTSVFKKDVIMVFHHLSMILGTLICIYLALIQCDMFEWQIALGFLSELSTPILNYIRLQRRMGKIVSKYLQIFFLIVYFICRPLNFSYLTIFSYQSIGWRHFPLAIGTYLCLFFLIINSYWFYVLCNMYQKYKKTKTI